MWEFWRRHKRKVYITLGAFGGGYLFYKLYDARRSRLNDLEKQYAVERENDELIKAQIQAHFESVQGISDSTTLPHVMDLLDCRIAENLDLTQLTKRLIQGKGQPNTLSTSEKLELWDKLKILSLYLLCSFIYYDSKKLNGFVGLSLFFIQLASVLPGFTKMILTLWSMTMLSLYIKVQVNILGRHLYIDTARGLGSSRILDEAELIDRNDEQQFLACADYLSNYGLLALISHTEAVASEVLKGAQLKDFFSLSSLHEFIIQILDTLLSKGSPHHWVSYLMPDDAGAYKLVASSSNIGSDIARATKYELLMAETRAVVSSAEFENIVDISLRALVSMMLGDLISEFGGGDLVSGMPLAKLLPRIARMSELLLQESNRNKYIQNIQTIPEVELFFTLLYSSTPTS